MHNDSEKFLKLKAITSKTNGQLSHGLKKNAQQICRLCKETFDNSFKTIKIFQEKNSEMMELFLKSATWVPEEGKAAVRNLIKEYDANCEKFKRSADENYEKMESYFQETMEEDNSGEP